MPVFVFFKRNCHIHVLEKNDKEGASSLIEKGFEKQFEEIQSPNQEKALKRFLDIRKDETALEYAFYYGSVLEGLGIPGDFPKTH